jgi:hypothetical protein
MPNFLSSLLCTFSLADVIAVNVPLGLKQHSHAIGKGLSVGDTKDHPPSSTRGENVILCSFRGGGVGGHPKTKRKREENLKEKGRKLQDKGKLEI